MQLVCTDTPFHNHEVAVMAQVKSLFALALEAIPAIPSPSLVVSTLLPRCHSVFEPVYNLYYEEEREMYRQQHRVLFK